MSDTNGNGNASKLDALAESAVLKLTARLAMPVLMAVLVWLFLQLWDGQDELTGKVSDLDRTISDKISALDRRILEVELRAQLREGSREQRRDDREDRRPPAAIIIPPAALPPPED